MHDQLTQTSRRTVLAGILAGAGGLALSGCNTGITDQAPAQVGDPGGAAMPDHVPFAGPTPDVPAGDHGVVPVFYNYPAQPTKRDGIPLTGVEPFSILMQGNPPNVPPARNQNFAQLNKRAGTEVNITYGSWSSYVDKFQVTMASGDIPDICGMTPVPQFPKLLEKHFADLSDVLGGDGIHKYPALANLPSDTWQVPSINGRIFGISKPLPGAGVTMNSRGDLLAERGIDDPNLELRDGSDFVALLKDLTDRDRNEFALGSSPTIWLMSIMKTMLGTPNVWSNDNGTFIHEYETAEFKDALNEAGKIVRAGVLHPNSFSDPGNNSVWFKGGVTALFIQDFVGWGTQARNNPDWKVGNIEIPRWDGGGHAPVRKSSPGYGAWVGFKKAEPDRLDQLLRFADYIASPFGTQEYLEVTYGVKDYSYRMDGPNPALIPDAPANIGLFNLGANHRSVLYGQGSHTEVDAQRDYLERVMPTGVDNATLGLYSETESTAAAALASEVDDLQRDIMQGAKPISEWDSFLKKWKSEVGDKMAAEYAEAAAARG